MKMVTLKAATSRKRIDGLPCIDDAIKFPFKNQKILRESDFSGSK